MHFMIIDDACAKDREHGRQTESDIVSLGFGLDKSDIDKFDRIGRGVHQVDGVGEETETQCGDITETQCGDMAEIQCGDRTET